MSTAYVSTHLDIVKYL